MTTCCTEKWRLYERWATAAAALTAAGVPVCEHAQHAIYAERLAAYRAHLAECDDCLGAWAALLADIQPETSEPAGELPGR